MRTFAASCFAALLSITLSCQPVVQPAQKQPFPNVVITVTPRLGIPLGTAAAEAIDVTNTCGQPVAFMFEGIELVVTGSDTAIVIEERHAKHKR